MVLLCLLLTALATAPVTNGNKYKEAQKAAEVEVGRWLNGLDIAQTSYPVPKFGYPYDAFEPWMDAHTVEAIHQQIHKERAFQMNQMLKRLRNSSSPTAVEVANMPLFDILQNMEKVPEKWRQDLANNIGGYINRLFFFAVLSPNPTGEERNATKIVWDVFRRSFVNFDKFQKMFNKTCLDMFGNGYVWMARVPKQRYMTIFSGLEEGIPLSRGMQPILGVDLWEHSYWTKYGNNKAEFIRNWWKLVDFRKLEAILNWWWSIDPFDPNYHSDL